MKIKKTLTRGAAAALIAAASLLAPGAPGADERTHRRALETLLKMFDMKERAKQSVDQMAALHVQQDPRLGPYTDVLRKFYAKNMSWKNLREEIINIYIKEFTEAEVRELIAFYRTPTGRKAIEKMPLLMEKCARIGNRRLLENMEEWNEMLQLETERLRKEQATSRAPDGEREEAR